MILYLIGIDYKSVPLAVRESAYRLRQRIAEYWQRVNPGRVAVLATCNRVEVYVVGQNKDETLLLVERFIGIFKNCFKNAYIKYGETEIFEHGLRLACGLESQLKGEIQILKQLETWLDRENLPFSLKKLWEQIIAAAREIRKASGLDKDILDVAEIIFDDLKRYMPFKKYIEIVVIGTGKIASLIANKKPESVHLIFVAHKKWLKAIRLAYLTGAETLSRQEMATRLITADAVISASSSPHYTLTLDDIAKLAGKRERTLYIYDVAIPRDVSPDVNKVSFVKTKNLDELAGVFYKRNPVLGRHLELAEELIENTLFKHKGLINVKESPNWYSTQPVGSKTG